MVTQGKTCSKKLKNRSLASGYMQDQIVDELDFPIEDQTLENRLYALRIKIASICECFEKGSAKSESEDGSESSSENKDKGMMPSLVGYDLSDTQSISSSNEINICANAHGVEINTSASHDVKMTGVTSDTKIRNVTTDTSIKHI